MSTQVGNRCNKDFPRCEASEVARLLETATKNGIRDDGLRDMIQEFFTGE